MHIILSYFFQASVLSVQGCCKIRKTSGVPRGGQPLGGVWGVPQYRLDKENHREKYSKKQSNSRKKQSCGSSNPANMDVFFEPFLLQFLLSKRYWGVPKYPFSPLGGETLQQPMRTNVRQVAAWPPLP